MASVFSRWDGKYWFAAYRGADGTRQKKITMLPKIEANRRKAEKMAEDYERAAEKARAGALLEDNARRVISDMVQYATGKPLEFATAESWFKTWLAGKKAAKKAPATLARYEQVTRDFLVHLGPRARLDLRALTADDVESFRTAEIASGKAEGTVRVAIKALSAAFNAASRKRIIEVNIAALEHGSKDGSAKQGFTPEQLTALLRVADAHRDNEWGTLIRLGYFVGGRLKSLARLTWGKVDWTKNIITLPPVKGQTELEIPIAADLADHLQALPSADDSAPIMPKLAIKGVGGNNGLSGTFGRLMTEAEIAVPILRAVEEGSKGRTVRALGFHSLRHTFNSRMANAGVSQEVRRKLTGHQSDAMNDRYTHHEREQLRVAIDMVPSILK